MKTFIVLIPVENNRDARKQCEDIENATFEVDDYPCDTISALKMRDKVIELIDDDTYNLQDIEVEPISDFMDRVNDEEFNPDAYFLSYVYGKQK